MTAAFLRRAQRREAPRLTAAGSSRASASYPQAKAQPTLAAALPTAARSTVSSRGGPGVDAQRLARATGVAGAAASRNPDDVERHHRELT